VTRVPGCPHVADVRDDWPELGDPVCEACVAAGSHWVSLRRCLSCGQVGCCDSSPGRHATAHHQGTGHPVIRSLQPGQDWVWCYVDERTLRREHDEWRDVDFFFEVGLGYMRGHLEAGGGPELDPDATVGKGFPLGAWLGEMRRRRSAGELGEDQAEALAELPGWSWV
jgi:CPA1 family monovalent cation:H+ antiporter